MKHVQTYTGLIFCEHFPWLYIFRKMLIWRHIEGLPRAVIRSSSIVATLVDLVWVPRRTSCKGRGSERFSEFSP